MLRERVDVDKIRQFVSELQFETAELLKLCDLIDFAENPSLIQSEYIDFGEVFSPTEIEPVAEEQIIESIRGSTGNIKTFASMIEKGILDE